MKYNRAEGKLFKDSGGQPLIIDIDSAAKNNPNFRTAVWTGKYLQMTLMSIPVGGEIGVELHDDTDQFLRVEQGCGIVMMGESKTSLREIQPINSHYAVVVPAGTWHNIVNNGRVPLKLYSIYAPPHHPFGTVHATKDEADSAH